MVNLSSKHPFRCISSTLAPTTAAAPLYRPSSLAIRRTLSILLSPILTTIAALLTTQHRSTILTHSSQLTTLTSAPAAPRNAQGTFRNHIEVNIVLLTKDTPEIPLWQAQISPLPLPRLNLTRRLRLSHPDEQGLRNAFRLLDKQEMIPDRTHILGTVIVIVVRDLLLLLVDTRT